MVTLLKHRDVCARTGLSSSQLFELVKRGSFPRPAKLGRASRYSDVEVDAWIAERLAERNPTERI